MKSAAPLERFPAIGTVESPALFYDGADILLCYQIAPVAGGGNALLAFTGVFDLRINPTNIQGLASSELPVKPWDFLEISNARRIQRWASLNPRLWTISFNDEMVEIVFKSVELVLQTQDQASPSACLRQFLCKPA